MKKKTNSREYILAALVGIVGMVAYLFFAIGDLMIKGYSDLPAYPFVFLAVMVGISFGLAIRKKK